MSEIVSPKPEQPMPAVSVAPPKTEELSALGSLRVAGILTVIFPVLGLFTIIIGSIGYSDPLPEWLDTVGTVVIWGLLLSTFTGLIGAIFALASGRGLPRPWDTVRVLLILAGLGEFFGPILLVVGFLVLLSGVHG